MSKSVTKARQKLLARTFGMNTIVRRIACDDGTTYVVEREAGTPRWEVVGRYDRDGSYSARPSRLPAAVEAHLDGITGAGSHGDDAREYWV